jgi:uncharacterized DUF497 family protein
MFIWDEKKNAANKEKHGLAFEVVQDFDWEAPVFMDRSRHEDGERRYAAVGNLYGKLHTVIFTLRDEDIRIISLRRSNSKEEKAYAETD